MTDNMSKRDATLRKDGGNGWRASGKETKSVIILNSYTSDRAIASSVRMRQSLAASGKTCRQDLSLRARAMTDELPSVRVAQRPVGRISLRRRV